MSIFIAVCFAVLSVANSTADARESSVAKQKGRNAVNAPRSYSTNNRIVSTSIQNGTGYIDVIVQIVGAETIVHDPFFCAQAATVSVFVFRLDGQCVCCWPPSKKSNEKPVHVKMRSGDLFGRRVGMRVSRDVSVDRDGIMLPKGKYLIQAHIDVKTLCGASVPAVDSTRRLRDPQWWVERKDVSISSPLLVSVTDDAEGGRKADEEQVIRATAESDSVSSRANPASDSLDRDTF